MFCHLQAQVQSVILDVNGDTMVDEEFQWTDDEDDVRVSNMMKLIENRFPFTSKCFVGGSTKLDVIRMREEAKAELLNRKTVKPKSGLSSQAQDGLDMDLLASMVREKLKEDFQFLHGNISTIHESANAFTETILANISEVYVILQDSVGQIATLASEVRKLAAMVPAAPVERANTRPSAVDAATQTIPDATTIINDALNFANRTTNPAAGDGGNGTNANTGVSGVTDNSCKPGGPEEQLPSDLRKDLSLDPALLFPNPTFSLGLTQEAQVVPPNEANSSDDTDPEGGDEDHVGDTIEEAGPACRKSKRQKLPTKSLMGEYECDKVFINRARKAVSDAIYKGGNIDYSAKFAALLDKLKTPFDISTERGNICSTDLDDVVQRSTQLSSKIAAEESSDLLSR
ncbi:hypothetical protein Bca4012_038977 [Brassica carinata]